MSAPRVRGITPLIKNLPLFPAAMRNVELFAQQHGFVIAAIEVGRHDFLPQLLIEEIHVIAELEGGERYGVSFMAGMEQLHRAHMALKDAADARRRAYHDWSN